MPGCGMHSRPKLAENARYNSLLKNKVSIKWHWQAPIPAPGAVSLHKTLQHGMHNVCENLSVALPLDD